MNYKSMGTGEIWLAVQRDLRGHALRGTRIGAAPGDDVSIYDMVNTAMSAAYAALKAAEEGLTNPMGVLRSAYQALIEAYHAAILAGFTAAAEGIATLAQRVGDAMREVGNAWADVFHAFLGASPAQMGLAVVALAGVGLIGAAVVLSGAGGQAALVSLAKRQVIL